MHFTFLSIGMAADTFLASSSELDEGTSMVISQRCSLFCSSFVL